ncbi:MAG: hypothetical protein ABSG78_01040 [Verrucomicrobiota bacterium]|jgi:hypothetical protein
MKNTNIILTPHFPSISLTLSVRLLLPFLLFLVLVARDNVASGQQNTGTKGRKQWTEKEAWDWERKIGVIKGFNEPTPAYPGMTTEDILQKASELGFNSVRIFLGPLGGRPAEHIPFLHKFLDAAEKKGMTVSPVLSSGAFRRMADDNAAREEAKAYVQNLIGEFRNDPRISLWDLWNEPNYSNTGDLDLCKEVIIWAREVSPIQPLTVSAFWLHSMLTNTGNVHERCVEVESMTDVHNFHLYDLSILKMKAMDDMISALRKISDRPIVCTEAVARTISGNYGRSMSSFEQNHIHFYSWGLYTADSNWAVSWGLSTFDPNEPMFHDLLHPDGTPYDWRDLEWVRNFHFAKPGEITDPGAEITERWDKWRAWKWMVAGPVKGLDYPASGTGNIAISNWTKEIKEAESAGYNGLRIKVNFGDWKTNSKEFFGKMDALIAIADTNNMRVMPALLSDADADSPESALSDYVSSVVKKYGSDPRIFSWELYTLPGEKGIDSGKLVSLLGLIFRTARFELPSQPLTATPLVRTTDFAPDFDYKRALVHGRNNGWNRLEFKGTSNPALCNYIWSLSDIISIASDMKMPETGWLVTIANRYGRPVVCSAWNAPDGTAVKETLEVFSRSHVFWYNAGNIADKSMIRSFRFIQIGTPRQ